MTHNGTIGHLEKCYEKLGIVPKAEVDSALIPAVLALRGPTEGLRFLKENSCGQATFAAVYDDGRLLLVRETRPLYIGTPYPGVIMWASEEAPVKKFCTVNSMGLEFHNVMSAVDSKYALWEPDSEKPRVGDFRLPYLNVHIQKKSGGGPVGQGFRHEPENKSNGVQNRGSQVPSGQRGLVESRDALDRRPVLVGKDVKRPICMWRSCWTRATDRVYLGKPHEAWAPCCDPHYRKVTKLRKEFELSPEHERRKKMEKMASVGS